MLIDRDKAIEAIEAKEANEYGDYREYNVAFNDGLRSAVFTLEDMPTAVIQCKGCKYHVGEGCCDYWDEGRMFLDISDSDYCSKAERRKK